MIAGYPLSPLPCWEGGQGGETTDMYKSRSMLTIHARALRNNPTDAERFLRQRWKSSQLGGVKFNRQEPSGRPLRRSFFAPGVRAAGKALQVFGGYGFLREYPIERMYRDVKGIEFGDGTNQIQKLIIMGELLKKKS
jgi:hypothetical protein